MPKLNQPTTKTVITVTHHEAALPTPDKLKTDKGLGLGLIARFFHALCNGGHIATVDVVRDGGDAVAASGTVTLAGASGTVGVTINGVAFSTTASGGDETTAADLAALVLASTNPLVQPFVTASSSLGVVTVTAKAKGPAGNTITLAASGGGATASGNRLTGGADATSASVATINT